MGIFSRFEDKMEDTVEGAASRVSKAPISPVQIAKKAEKQMRRETMVGAGKQFAPTLYTVLVNPDDDDRLFGYYPTLAGEIETYLSAKATENGLVMDGNPLVRFIVDDGLRHGKFDVIAEVVAAPIVVQLREEEMVRYGIVEARDPRGGYDRGYDRGYDQGYDRRGGAPQPYDARPGAQPYDARPGAQQSRRNSQPVREKPPLPYVPEEEIDRSIDYGEYTFNSEDFEDYRNKSENLDAPLAYNDAEFAQADSQPLDGDSQPLGYDDRGYDDYDDRGGYDAYRGEGDRQGGYPAQDGYSDYRQGYDARQGGYEQSQDGFDVYSGGYDSQTLDQGSPQVPSQPLPERVGRHQARPQVQEPNTVVFAAGAAGAGAAAGAGGRAAGATPAAPDHRTVVARLIDRTSRRPYDLAGTRLTLGRETGNDIVVADINASRRHAELTLNQQGLWVITDLGSMNGTLVNGVSVASQPLYPGDIVTLGRTDYEFALV